MDDKPNTPMTPREYVILIAGPTLADLLARRDDRRLAYLACLTIYHCVDAIGLAEAACVPGFDQLQGGARRRAVDKAAESVRDVMQKQCGTIFTVVHGIANGTKHPARLPLLPGSERKFGIFGFGPGYAGFDEGRWSFPGLGLEVDEEVLFLDACAQQVLAAFVCAYPAHLGSIVLSFLDWGLPVPGLDLQPEWVKWIRAWAKQTPSVAEVWLFGSRAKGTATVESDVDLALVLMPGDQGHDWPLGNWMALATRWQGELEDGLDRHVSLELFARAGEEEGAPEAKASAILLWQRAEAWPTDSRDIDESKAFWAL